MRLLLTVLLAMSCILWGAEPLRVVTAHTVVQDLTQRIAGERFAVSCLLRPGTDSHHYQPVPDDARRLAQADVVVINGLGFEGWFERLSSEAGFRGRIIVASAGIVPLAMQGPACGEPGHDHAHHHDHGHAVPDPHAFHSVLMGVRYAENIRDGLIAADGTDAEGIRSRAATVIGELRQLDAWARVEIARIPAERRILVTNHDALQYFARDYGFQIRAPNTAMEDSEASAKQVAELVDFIRAHGVRGVFLEAGKQARVVEQIAREAGVKVGGGLYLDGLGPAGSPAATYADLFRANVATIVTALE